MAAEDDPGNLYQLCCTSMPVVYSTSGYGYTNDESNEGPVMPALPPPERSPLVDMQYSFFIQLNALDAHHRATYARISGRFAQSYEQDAVCTGGVFVLDSVEPVEAFSHVSIPPVLDIRIYDRRFSGMRRRAYARTWRPENEMVLEQFIATGGSRSFWYRMTTGPLDRFASLAEYNLPPAETEIFVQALCFIAAAMYLKKYSPNFPFDLFPRSFVELHHGPPVPDTTFDRTVGVGLCRISPSQFNVTNSPVEMLRYLMAPVIVSHHDVQFTEHTQSSFVGTREPGNIEYMLSIMPERLRRWAQDKFHHCSFGEPLCCARKISTQCFSTSLTTSLTTSLATSLLL